MVARQGGGDDDQTSVGPASTRCRTAAASASPPSVWFATMSTRCAMVSPDLVRATPPGSLPVVTVRARPTILAPSGAHKGRRTAAPARPVARRPSPAAPGPPHSLRTPAARPSSSSTTAPRGRTAGGRRGMDVDDVFVGRSAELATLAADVDAAAAGRGRTVVVSGAPGAGKTRLVRRALDARPPGGDLLVLHGGCVERSGGHYPSVPFAPFVEALRGLRGTDAPADLQAAARAWVRPGAGPLPGDTSAGEDQVYRRFTELLDVLQDAAAWRPLVLVLDDLQWADPSSLALLASSPAASPPSRCCWPPRSATRSGPRTSTSTAPSPSCTAPPRCAGCTSTRCPTTTSPRSSSASAALAAPERDVRAVVRRAEGNALAAAELARHRGEDDLPRSYASAVVARLAGLSPDALDVLRVVATVGRATGPEPVARLVDALAAEATGTPGGAAPPDGADDDPAPHGPGTPRPARPCPGRGRPVRAARGDTVGVRAAARPRPRGRVPRHPAVARPPPARARGPRARARGGTGRPRRPRDPRGGRRPLEPVRRRGRGVRRLRRRRARRGRCPGVPGGGRLLRRALGHRDRLEPPLAHTAPPAAVVRLELAEALRLAGDVGAAIALLEETLRGPVPPATQARCWSGWPGSTGRPATAGAGQRRVPARAGRRRGDRRRGDPRPRAGQPRRGADDLRQPRRGGRPRAGGPRGRRRRRVEHRPRERARHVGRRRGAAGRPGGGAAGAARGA